MSKKKKKRIYTSQTQYIPNAQCPFNITFAYTSRKVPSNKQFPPLNLKNLVYLHHP